MDVFYAYRKDEECAECVFGKEVLTQDFDTYVICFYTYDKSRIFVDEVCKHLRSGG